MNIPGFFWTKQKNMEGVRASQHLFKNILRLCGVLITPQEKGTFLGCMGTGVNPILICF